MPRKRQSDGSRQYQTKKRRLADTKNTETLKALLRGCETEAELREWMGAFNATSAPTEAKEYCAALIRQRGVDDEM